MRMVNIFKNKKSLSILSTFIFFALPSYGFDTFMNSSRYQGMAGAGIAATSKIGMEDFGLINPAILSTNADLSFAGGYYKGKRQDQDVSGFSFSVLDTTKGAWDSARSDIMPDAGFPLSSILYYTNQDFDQFKDQYFHLGLSQPLSSRMSLGFTVNYSMLKSDGLNISENVWDFGAGFLWKVFHRWTVGLSAMNIMDRRDEFVPGYLRRGLGAGVEFAPNDNVKIRGDFWRARDALDETQSIVKIGVLNQITESFALQLGYSDDKVIDTKVLAAGFIINGPKLSLSYSINRQTSYNDLLHSVDFRLPVW